MIRILTENNIKTSVSVVPSDENVLSEKAANTLIVDKAKAVIGKNKVDTSKSLIGRFIWSYGDESGVGDDYAITDYIPVSANVIKNQTQMGGTGNNVYNSAKVKLRTFTTSNYTFEAGDAYICFSYDNRLPIMVESGDEVTTYEPFTDKGDAVEVVYTKVEATYPFTFIDLLKIFCDPIGGGSIKRDYGFDIPTGSTGNGTMLHIRFPKIAGKFKVEFELLTNITADKYYLDPAWPFSVENGSDGVVIFSEQYDNPDDDIEAFIYPSGTSTSINRYCRVSRAIITPLDYVSFYELKKLEFNKNEIIEVCQDFTSETSGYGVSRFTTLVAAHNAATSYIDHKTKIRVMPGTYDEFETVWAGVDAESSTDYKGIICKNNVIYESFDPQAPELTTLKWDGHAGFSTGHVMDTETQAMTRCIFHITNPETYTEIRGFKIWSKNTRYCLHPETAGIGAKNKWVLENLIFDWNGRGNTENPTFGTHLGIGISAGEVGNIIKCKFEGTVSGGIAGHNNGWYVAAQGAKPFICPGAKLHIKGCNFNGNDFDMSTYQEDADLPDSLTIEDSMGIDVAGFSIISPATTQNWKAYVINSEITTNNF